MSISSNDKDKDELDKVDKETGKKYVRIWRLEASKEFILLLLSIVALLGTSLFNPWQLLQIANQNLDNTDIIIDNQNTNWGNVSKFITVMESERKSTSVDVINIIFLYLIENNHKLDQLLDHTKINDSQFDIVKHNSSHIWVEGDNTIISDNVTFSIPYPMNLTNLMEMEDNNTKVDEIAKEVISNITKK